MHITRVQKQLKADEGLGWVPAVLRWKQFVELVDFECEWVMDGEISDGDDEVIWVWNQAYVIRTSMK